MATRVLSAVTLAANATAEKIFTYVPERRTTKLRLINRQTDGVTPENVDIGFDNTVTTGAGIPIADTKEEIILSPKSDIWAIVATAADSNIVIVEEYLGEVSA